MQYFAGLFDAEGYVSLNPKGGFTVAIEMTNEPIMHLLKETFGGSIYSRQREKRKKCWAWKINSIQEQTIYFINSIVPFSVVKSTQLKRLGAYLDQSREDRKQTREITCKTLRNLKKPFFNDGYILPRREKPIEEGFFKWLAGFIDGDGNFTCHEYIDNRDHKKYFSHQISISNTFPEAIAYVNDRIEGCITTLTRNVNPVFKWVPKRCDEKFICDSIIPFLILKKEQCKLLLEFSCIDDKIRKYEITKQIKHLNSL